ncbi:MAG: hypothetical protein ACRD2W_12055 [Acidimicrobiales bacterium]
MLVLPTGPVRLPGPGPFNREAVIIDALGRVASSGSAWLAADLARETTTLVPAEAAASAAEPVRPGRRGD